MNERCDRCGARAAVHVVLKSEGQLWFCGHHFAEVEDAITPQAEFIFQGELEETSV